MLCSKITNRINRAKFVVLGVLFIILTSLLLMCRQLTTAGYFGCVGIDAFAYTSWAFQFTEALKEGVLYPKWAALNFWGYGSPTFILRSPLAFYLVAFFNMFTGSILVAMNIAKFVALALSGAGMFFLVKEFYSEKVALITAAYYITAPYVIFQTYIFGTFSSNISLFWFPLILLFAYRFVKRQEFKWVVCSGFCYAGLILTHLVNAYIFTFVLMVFICSVYLYTKMPNYIVPLFTIIIIGLLLSAAYILPFVLEMKYFNHNTYLTEYHNSYRYLLPNMTSKLGPYDSWTIYYKRFALHFIFFFVMQIIFLILNVSRRRKEINDNFYVNMFFIVIAFVSIFFLFGASELLWKYIPFFQYIILPYRWLNITAFSIAFLFASGVSFLATHCTKKSNFYFSVGLLFAIYLLVDFHYIKNAPVYSENELFPVKAVNWFSEDMPAGVKLENIDKDDDFKAKLTVINGKGHFEVVSWKSAERVIHINASEPLTIRIRTFNFPGWTGYIDGKQTGMKTEAGSKAIILNVPEGKHIVNLKFVDTTCREMAKYISLGAIFLSLSYLIFTRKLSDCKSR